MSPYARRRLAGVRRPGRHLFLSPSAPAAPGGTVIIEDTFTAANGTNPDGRTPSPTNTPGNNWLRVRGSWDIQSNKLRPTAVATIGVVTGAPDFTIEVDVTTAATVDAGLGIAVIAHMQNNNDGVGTFCGWDNGIGYRMGNAGIGVTPVLDGPVAASLAPSTTYHWKIVALADGTTEMWVDGVLVLSDLGGSTAFGTTAAIFSADNGNHPTFDNFKVTTP